VTNPKTNKYSLSLLASLLLLGGCAQMYQQPAKPAVAYHPPGAALAALPAGAVTRFSVAFASNSADIDAAGMTAISGAADLMQTNAAFVATVIGSSDPSGSDAGNMLLSKQRAMAVHTALLQTGKVTEQRIETRWMGDRPQASGDVTAAPNVRGVEIAVH
jgi:OOP family OmpA-OmpF porin